MTRVVDGEVRAPGSKSHTHRAYVLAAQAEGDVEIRHPLRAADPDATLDALRTLGAEAEGQADVRFRPAAARRCSTPVDLHNAGTGLRLVTAYAARLPFATTLTGDASLRTRPNRPLLDALRSLGARIDGDDHCPFTVQGPLHGGEVHMSGATSSQFTSALLLSLPMAPEDSTITLAPPVRSRPYLDITRHVADAFGLRIVADRDTFHVPGGQTPRGTTYEVPGDWSTAAFPLAAAAVTGGRVRVRGLADDPQGDKAIVDLLQAFGANVTRNADGVTIEGGDLRSPGQVDVSATPDLFPALTVVAACARGTTTFTGGATLRHKECDRIRAMAQGLTAMGIAVEESPDGLTVTGGQLRGARIHSHDDHRIHMAFTIAGLAAEGSTQVDAPECVAVSYPDFHADLRRLTEAA